MKKIVYIVLLLSVTLCSCKHVVDEDWVNLDDFSTLDAQKAFIPYACTSHSIADFQIPMATDTSGMRKTSSFNSTNLGKELYSLWGADRIRSFSGTYMSIDENGDSICLSGRILMPADGMVSRIMIANHFTIGNNAEAPTQSFPLEGIFASRGLAVIMADYIGYGVTADRIHPYLCADLTARNVSDLYFAALPFLKYINCSPAHDDIFLFGYSQGGAVTLSVHQYLQSKHPDVSIRLVMAGGGPYDICATYDKMVENDITDYPCAIPMIIQGLNVGMDLDLNYAEYFTPEMCANLDKWVNSKKYYMEEITAMMGTNRLSDILTESARNKVSEGMTDLYLAMLENSIAHYYSPQDPVYLFHSMTDNVVPFENAVILRENLNAYNMYNVTYNFGDYGSHKKSFLRFLYTTLTLLNDNGDIRLKE